MLGKLGIIVKKGVHTNHKRVSGFMLIKPRNMESRG